jgi:hypothetical protein
VRPSFAVPKGKKRNRTENTVILSEEKKGNFLLVDLKRNKCKMKQNNHRGKKNVKQNDE